MMVDDAIRARPEDDKNRESREKKTGQKQKQFSLMNSKKPQRTLPTKLKFHPCEAFVFVHSFVINKLFRFVVVVRRCITERTTPKFTPY